jgi:hypothetical protein
MKKTQEQRWIAPETIALIMALVLVLPGRYQVFSPLVRYGLIGVATVMLIIWAAQPRDKPETHIHAVTGNVAIALFAFLILSSLFKLIYDMLYRPDYVGGLPLLFAGVSLWLSNAIVFGIWYWLVDRGGPEARENQTAPPELLFAQMTIGSEPDWKPRFFDYIYLGFTNSTAFSPTDTLPLSMRMKALMMVQALISLVTIAMVAARAVNILK